jgi:hypothetical protein
MLSPKPVLMFKVSFSLHYSLLTFQVIYGDHYSRISYVSRTFRMSQ